MEKMLASKFLCRSWVYDGTFYQGLIQLTSVGEAAAFKFLLHSGFNVPSNIQLLQGNLEANLDN